ncbi:uncharacterized protein LOC122011616 isoform X4 [Zingiber officinale]|uniref:uncharacterized protein LOC122011616 isoform X4 n=1 Tax=Zingiber officinale TaxID=94328 RepID=UPI001C4DAB1E|nr:uncharacterized protein LOC122011616 isoform X4 [Zingiber officinale]
MFPPAAAAAAFRHRSEPPSFYRSRAARCIRLVQHLIERCLTFHLDREDCARVLAKRANIQPVVTNAELDWQCGMDCKERILDFLTFITRIWAGGD